LVEKVGAGAFKGKDEHLVIGGAYELTLSTL
jgi:hypothetical protein